MIRNGFFCMKFLDPVDMENCERENCMYQHISDNDEEKNEDSDKETDENDDEADAVILNINKKHCQVAFQILTLRSSS